MSAQLLCLYIICRQALHEAVRSGNTRLVELLVEHGAALDTVTRGGGTPLWWARRILPRDHSIVLYLLDLGAPEVGEFASFEGEEGQYGGEEQ